MEIKKDSLIKWECNNWYVREDNLVQICTQDGGTTILNPMLTKIWININYETNIVNLWEFVKDTTEWEDLVEIIEKFNIYGLVRITDENNEFDIIFN